MLALVVFVFALLFGVGWGAGENRLWREQGEGVILSHFKLYHLCMALLFGWVNGLTVCVAFGLGSTVFSVQALLLWFWLMLWDALALDVAWWVIRYLDLTHLGEVMFAFKLFEWEWVVTYPEKNEYDHGFGKPWHSREDWDNWLHPPLVLGTYCWWFVFAGILVVLGVLML